MSLRGKKQSDEHIAKRVEARAGFQHSEETKQKLSIFRKGRKMSQEDRDKLKGPRECMLSELSKLDTMKDPRPGYRGYFAANTVDDIRCKAKKRGKEWSIDSVYAYKLIIASCHYCGHTPNWPESRVGIDRIDNNKGYIYGNCVSCCFTCNSAKKELTTEEFIDWIKRIYNHSIKETV
jgi:NUMOD3 motif